MVNLVLTQDPGRDGQGSDLDQDLHHARTSTRLLLARNSTRPTDPWGSKVTRVELRDIMPSPGVQQAMEMQMSAEREKAGGGACALKGLCGRPR